MRWLLPLAPAGQLFGVQILEAQASERMRVTVTIPVVVGLPGSEVRRGGPGVREGDLRIEHRIRGRAGPLTPGTWRVAVGYDIGPDSGG